MHHGTKMCLWHRLEAQSNLSPLHLLIYLLFYLPKAVHVVSGDTHQYSVASVLEVHPVNKTEVSKSFGFRHTVLNNDFS